MPDNLGPSSTNASDRRPHQQGKAKGTKSQSAVEEDKEWLIDTGAEISAITKDNADKFDLTPIGGSASATTGNGGILVKSGLTMVFEIDSGGTNKEVSCNLDVGVKPDNTGSEILGMDQLAWVDAG